jgi:uncharacterized protein
VQITFDPWKRNKTLAERGLDFLSVAEVFATTHHTKVAIGDFAETRYFTIGKLDGRAVVVVWTQRGESFRIISMRYAHESERKFYSQYLD